MFIQNIYTLPNCKKLCLIIKGTHEIKLKYTICNLMEIGGPNLGSHKGHG